MKKVFENGEIPNQITELAKYQQVLLNVKPGDRITSKEGFLLHSPMTGKKYIVHTIEIMNGGGFCALGNKEEIQE